MTVARARFAAALDLLARDRRHGATWLAARAAQAVAAAVHESMAEGQGLVAVAEDAARRVAAVRPSMVALGNAAAELCVRLRSATDARRAAPELAGDLERQIASAAQACATRAQPLLRGVVLTHSASSFVLAALRAAAPASIFVTESRPLREGRQTAAALARAGLRVVLVTEAQMAVGVREAAYVLLGADALLPDGSFVNKVGSAPLALAARHVGRPVYVVSDLLKACATVPPFEEDPAAQVWSNPPAGVHLRNVVFERVEASLVTAYITEQGIFSPRELAAEVGARAARWAWVWRVEKTAT